MHVRKWDAYRVYLILSGSRSFLFSLMFTLNMVYEAQVVGLTPLQLVLVGTTLEIMCFSFEIPTGIIADLYSRRLSVIVGFFLLGIGFIIEGSLPFFWAMLLTQVFGALGSTFLSGALEAWIVDEVGEERMGKAFLRASQIGQIAGIIGTVLSVALGSIMLALPVVIGGMLLVVLALFLVVVMPENGFQPKPRGKRAHWQAMISPAREGLRLVRLRPILLTFLAIALVGGLYSEGFDRLEQVHLLRDFILPSLGTLNPVVWFAIIGIVGSIPSALLIEFVHRRLNMESQKAITHVLMVGYAVTVAALLVFALAQNFWFALVALWVAGAVRNMIDPLLSTWTNRHIDSDVRATMLSSFGQFNAVGQIAGGPAVGFIGNAFGLRAALSTAALLLSPAVWLIARTRHTERPAEGEAVVVELPAA